MTTNRHHPRILFIGPAVDKTLLNDLKSRYGFVVSHERIAQNALQSIQKIDPDLIVLNAAQTKPTVDAVLSMFISHQVTKPVVLIGANGDIAAADIDYPNLTGWISHPYTPDELATMIHAALAQPAINRDLVLAKRAELIEANRQLSNRVQQLQTLFDIGKSIAAELDLEAVLHAVVEAAVKLTEADESYLLLVNEVSNRLYLRAEANIKSEEVKSFSVPVTDSIAGQVVQTGQSITLSRDDSRVKIKTDLMVYALLNVPVRTGKKVIGVLGVNNRVQKRAFSRDDEQLLSALADWAAIAIHNAQLFHTMQQSSQDLKLVNEVSRLVSSTFNVHEIPRLLLQRAAEIVGAECGSLALIDRERDGVTFQLAYDHEGKELKGLQNFMMPIGEGIVGLVAEMGQPVIANDVTRHPAWSPLPDQITGFKTQKIIAVPLIAEGEILGVIELLNKKEGDFLWSDVDLLSLVASSAAIAIQNARQYTALKQTNEALHEAHQQRVAAERWAVLGKAAASLAHRINNTTTIIPIAAEHTRELLKQVDMPPELRNDIDENLDRIWRNSLYTVELAAVLLRRFRKEPTDAHDVNELVEKALELVELPDNIKVMSHLGPNLPSINTSDLLTDVFVEMINNAVKALSPKGGWLRVATFKSGDEGVSIQFTDNGPGVAPENLGSIFDMFYTTHPNGLGFGLWWVKTFLEQQHGKISVESRPGEGATFTITLPQNSSSLRSR